MSTRDVSQQTPSLFEAPLLGGVRDILAPIKDEKGSDVLAKEFVRWCFSFGTDFRNSPDITNLWFWAEKTKSKIEEDEARQILATARPLFFKRIEQLTRKAEAAAN
jgi:hypothetical protein